MEVLESVGPCPRQARYQAALCPDMKCVTILKRGAQVKVLVLERSPRSVSNMKKGARAFRGLSAQAGRDK